MIVVTTDKEKLAREAGEGLTKLLRDNADKDIFLLLSGGSCLATTKFVDTEVLGPNLTIGPMDDRFSLDPGVNNWLSVQNLEFYKHAVEADVCTADILPKE